MWRIIAFIGARPVPLASSSIGSPRSGRNQNRPYGPEKATESPTPRSLNTHPSVHLPPADSLMCNSIRCGSVGVLAMEYGRSSPSGVRSNTYWPGLKATGRSVATITRRTVGAPQLEDLQPLLWRGETKLRVSERIFRCEVCGYTADRDRNAAANLAALAAGAGGASSPSCGATKNEPAGNPHETSLAGNGYSHGKTPEINVA